MDRYFAQVPADAEVVVGLVRREAAEECSAGHLPPPELDRCVREAVGELWGSRISTFVPLLALRRVRCCIRAGTCECDDW